MALILALGIPAGAYLVLTGEGRLRLLWMAYLPLAMSAIGLSGSRGSSLAAAVAILVVLAWMRRKNPALLIVAATLLLAGVTAVWIQRPETVERVLGAGREVAGGTLSDRTRIWAAGWRVFAENSVVGVGLGAFPGAVSFGLGYPRVAHNTPLSVATETGLIGLSLFLAAPAMVMVRCFRAGRDARLLATGLLLAWLVGTSALTWEHKKVTWFVFLVGAMACETCLASARTFAAKVVGVSS